MNNLVQAKKRRIEYLDFAKTLAIFCVILCHCIEKIYYYDVSIYQYFSNFSKIFSSFCFVIGRCGVPFFLFVSGALLINKRIDTYDEYKKFIKNNFLMLFLATEIWIIIYNIFLFLIDAKRFDFIYLMKSMLFFKQLPLMNMWYMPMILGIYLVIPFVAKAIKGFENSKALILVGFISIISNMLVPTVNFIFTGLNLENVVFYINAGFLGGFVGIYLVTGYLSDKGVFRSISLLKLVCTSIIALGICVWIQCFALKYNCGYIWYDCIFLYVCTVCLFETFKRIRFDKIPYIIRNVIQKISKYSLALYFIHIIIVMIIGKYIILFEIPSIVRFIILFISTIVFSFALIEGLSTVGFVKKIILHIS